MSISNFFTKPNTFKEKVKSLVSPKFLKSARPIFHGLKSYITAVLLGFPAKKLKIIAITGTKGKTSTSVYVGRLMNANKLKTAYITTALTCIDGQNEELNKYKMSTLDGITLNQLAKKALENGCKYLVLELSSQGLEQNRHWGMGKFVAGLFLNIYPEHIEAHGSFEAYFNCKKKLFKSISKDGVAILNNKTDVAKYSLEISKELKCKALKLENDIKILDDGKLFKSIIYKNSQIKTAMVSDIQLENMAFAIKTVNIFTELDSKSVENLNSQIPGRFEWVVFENQLLTK
jgi:UDP-N-acetylmuramyl tripeptide synthase